MQNTIDRLVFKPHLSYSNCLQLWKGQFRTISDNAKWNLADEKYAKYQMNDLWVNIDQALVVYLNLNRISRPFILKEIKDVSFKSMRNLCLQNNCISSIESFCKIHCPVLEILWLTNNNIVNIRPLAKSDLRNLEWLSLKNNPVLEYDLLFMLNSSLTQLELDLVENDVFSKNRKLGVLNWLFKTDFRLDSLILLEDNDGIIVCVNQINMCLRKQKLSLQNQSS